MLRLSFLFAALLATTLAGSASVRAQGQCDPPCLQGTVCDGGRCVAPCDPPCAQGEQCMSDGQCVVTAAPASAPPRRVSLAELPPSPTEAAIGGWVGVGGAAVMLLVGATSPYWAFDQTGSFFLRVVSTGLFLTTGLVTQALAGFSRTHPEVRGAVGLRITGWIGYGITAAVGLATVAAPTVGPEVLLATTLLGTATLTAFALDAFITAAQARTIARTYAPASAFSLLPSVGLAQDPERRTWPTLGMIGRF